MRKSYKTQHFAKHKTAQERKKKKMPQRSAKNREAVKHSVHLLSSFFVRVFFLL